MKTRTMKKWILFGLVFLMIAMSLSSGCLAESDGSVIIVLTTDSPTTLYINGELTPQVTYIEKEINPFRLANLRRRMDQLAAELGETDYNLAITVKNLGATMEAVNWTIGQINNDNKLIYTATMKIGDLEARFNETTVELRGFEKYTDEQLAILDDDLKGLRSEIRMELAALTERVDTLEERVDTLEESHKSSTVVADTRWTWTISLLVSCFAVLVGIFISEAALLKRIQRRQKLA